MFQWEDKATRKECSCGYCSLICEGQHVAFFFYEAGFVKHYDMLGQELEFDSFLTIADAKLQIEQKIAAWVKRVATVLSTTVPIQ